MRLIFCNSADSDSKQFTPEYHGEKLRYFFHALRSPTRSRHHILSGLTYRDIGLHTLARPRLKLTLLAPLVSSCPALSLCLLLCAETSFRLGLFIWKPVRL